MLTRLFIPALSFVALAGCAHRFLHDPQAKLLAESAAQHLEAAKLSDLSKQRAVHEELTRQGLSAIRRQYGKMRDLRLVAVLAEPDQAAARQLFLQYVDKDLSKLGAQCEEQASAERLARRNLRNIETTYSSMFSGKTYLVNGQKTSYPPASCEGDFTVPPAAEGAALWSKFTEACAALKSAEEARRTCIGSTGELAKVRAELDRLRETKTKIAEAIAKLDGDLAMAYMAYGTAVEAAREEKITPDVQEAAKLLQKALGAYDTIAKGAKPADDILKKVGVNGFSAAVTLRGLEKRLGLLRELLPAAGAGEIDAPAEPTPDSAWSKSERLLLFGAVSRVPGLLDRAQELLDQSLLPPLLFEINRFDVERQRAALEDRRLDRAIELYQLHADALQAEADHLSQASRMFQRAVACQPATAPDPRAAAVFAGLPPRCREDAAGAMLIYAQAWTYGVIPSREAEYQLIVLAHEKAVDESELNMRAWHDLIAVPLSQLVAIYSSGISEETIANLVIGIITAAGWAGTIVGAQAVSK